MYTADFHFTQDDIYANRYGKLTPEQEKVVAAIYQTRLQGARQTILVFITLFFVLMVFGMGVEFSQWEGAGSLLDFLHEQGPIFVMISAGFFVLLLVVSLLSLIIAADAKRRHISTAEGVAQVFIGQSYARGSYMRYELTLKQGLFRTGFFRFMSETALRQFEAGKRYRVYYIKFYPFPILLSAEVV